MNMYCRAVARSENPGGLAVLGGENVQLNVLPKNGGPTTCDSPVYVVIDSLLFLVPL